MAEKKSFKALEQELEAILQRLEHGEYEDLEELLADHNKGTKLINELTERLETAKTTITHVKKLY